MSAKDVSAICFKLLAIYVLITVIISIPAAWGLFFSVSDVMPGTEPGLMFPVLMSLITLVIGLTATFILWKVSTSLSDNVKSNAEESYSGFNIQHGYKLLGIYFLVTGLSYLPTSAIQIWRLNLALQAGIADYIQVTTEPLVLIFSGVFLLSSLTGKKLWATLKYSGT
ncbi:hypothetical protein [Lacimicrobium alkaliphilum]|uniref:Uncharacterized protein n=1 Tax=Lacimicrobium alkaliphilum TaxID=1526571 RepID=A0A0U2JJ14_9ALTE|nr:hypothetical protein [Lacimicrobium alkaliphilum]ALS98662.1 hypothetical protein AT746_10545 [Lacimicrobium alkaliphilum]